MDTELKLPPLSSYVTWGCRDVAMRVVDVSLTNQSFKVTEEGAFDVSTGEPRATTGCWLNLGDTWEVIVHPSLRGYTVADDFFPETLKADRQSILDEASKLINGDREADYGDPKIMHQLIGDLWVTYLGLETKLTPDQVAMMMALMKIARSTSSPKFDTYVDLAGYAALAGEMSK